MTDVEIPTNVAIVADQVSVHLTDILAMFRPEAKITVLVRTPGMPQRDFMLGNDEIDEAIAQLERSKTRKEVIV